MQLTLDEINEAIEMAISSGVEEFGLKFKIAIINILNLERMKKTTAILDLEKNIETTATLIKEKIIDENKQKSLIPLSKWNEFRNYPTVGALRQMYHRRKETGFDDCVILGGPNGGKILIDPVKFDEWQINRRKKKEEK